MAEEVKQETPVVEKPEKPETEPAHPAVVEKEIAAPEPEKKVEEAAEEVVTEKEKEKEKEKPEEEKKISESASFKEESNVVADLPNPQQKALDELKKLVKEALEKHEFTAPPPPPVVEEKKAVPEPEKKEEESASESKPEEKKEEEKPEAEKVVEEAKAEETASPAPAPPAEEKADDVKVEDKEVIPPPPEEKKVEEKVESVEEDAGKAVEEIKETIVEVTTPPPPPTSEEEPQKVEETKTEAEAENPEPPTTDATPPPAPEEVSIWGVKLLEDEKSDTILLKFLRARDFKVKEAFAMLKSVVAWRKSFGIDELISDETSIPEGVDKVVYLHGVDKEGHPVLYNAFGEFQNKELYQKAFADAEKRSNFLKGIIVFLEKSIRNLDFTPDGICTLFQVIDLKNSPGLFFFKKDLRQAINQALQLFQDNYPEFVAKQVYINVPWWYPAYYRMYSVIFTPRTKSKFVFAGPSKSSETLFKYIAPEQVPVQYGGLSREDCQEFSSDDAAIEETINPSSKHTIEFEASEKCTLVWELRVVGWDVTHGAEFVPSAEGGYTVIIQKSRKVGPSDEPIISTSYKIGEPGKVVLTFDNQTSKKKKLVYRSKNKPSD